KVVDTLDEPFGDASIIPTYLLSGFTRGQVKVALGGDGGDEVFLGYPTYQAHRLAEVYARVPAGMRELLERGIASLPVSMENISLDFKLKRFVAGAGESPAIRNSIWLGSFPPGEAREVLAPGVRDALSGKDGTEPLSSLLAG